MSKLMIVEVPSYSCEFKGIREVCELVRCKECKYWKDFECQCDWASTDHEGGASYSLDREADDYCSYGERSE